MDFVLALFPAGSGLGQSVITTVWVGTSVVCLLNLRFGFPLTGLVVPGYLVPLLIISPTSAAVIIIEAIVVYGFMRISASYLMERFGYSEMFGRDRFFAIILISILVRVCMDTLFWPIIADQLSLWDITFDYASQLYSLGLIIIALTANVMWNGGFKYGLKVSFIQLFITYILVRFVLMPFTNFSIANLGIMYEAVAASIIAAPKAYIILVITAFLASRANLKYGWEFNGIMLPALLALQLTQPSKILTSFIENCRYINGRKLSDSLYSPKACTY
ncbi:poly-gamma-glutamate biosynthesis protein PgsC/CapC [Pseudoalteromonas sp. SCSIO 43101]|uniref:poly-gamma-glutamate biosynthesis protein PgsC/CapC n=1 Tax=Pseudoalteromonas sp. SCSIO 43101 TaxID=2822847 RepID=UPI00202B427D|nr:poly-gamma-glutamate biosynthesis protein PgsC/CapC [Pseudoalteromonas sp. SCSIO 43101]